MNEHDRYQELISRMLDEELTPEDKTSLALHLKECPECAAVYAAFSALSDTLGADLEEPPERLRENVMAQIRREEIRKKNSNRKRWITYASVAAVLVLVLTAFPRIRDHRADLSASAAGAYQQAAVAVTPAAPTAMAEEAAADEADSAMFSVAAPAEAAENAVPGSAAVSDEAVPVFDLSDQRSLADVDALLDGAGADSPDALPSDAQALFVIICADGEITVFSVGDQLFCLLPDGSLRSASYDAQALLQALQG